jgi:hypothetical protein
VKWLCGTAFIVLAACGAPSHGFGPTPTVPARPDATAKAGSPASFVSELMRPDGRVIVGLSDAATGKLLRTLYVVHGFGVSGTAVARTGDIWITLDRGPAPRSDVAGGDPQPYSCASKVIDISPDTGATHVVMRGGNDELITEAQPSPTDDRVAYLHSGCATSYFNNSLQIRDRDSGHVISIGEQLPRCHVLEQPRWSADGRRIALIYGPASTTDFRGGQGTCSQPRSSRLVVVSAARGSAQIAGNVASLERLCSVNAIAITRHGLAAVEQCTKGTGGIPQGVYIDGPTRLIRYSPTLRILARSALGQCEDGASMAGRSSSDEVVISTYQYCGGTNNTPPVTKVVVVPGNQPRPLLALPGGQLSIDDISY